MSRAAGRYRVLTEGRVVVASLRGRMKHHDDRVLVGDHVGLLLHADGSVTIESIAERKSLLQRRRPGGRRGVRAVAANVEQAVVVGSAREPDWDPVLIDRFLAVCEASQLPVLLVINKTDLDPAHGQLATPYQTAGYQVICASVRNQTGLQRLREVLTGHISLLTGPTGVGKSSLLNALQPGLSLRTQAVSARGGGGRHTTVAAEMHALQPQGFVVDTPGLRDIGLWGLEPSDVARAFPEIAAAGGACRFDNCRHLGEPGCAVEIALVRGDVAESRIGSYRKLLAEALDASHPWK